MSLTIEVDADYRVVRTADLQRRRHRRGSDPALRGTYVAFGATTTVGYAETGNGPAGSRPLAPDDRIWNGADDDGSGTVALLAIAKAFATTQPRRSVLFVWHAGEERGLWGSRYSPTPHCAARSPSAQLNIDMIGRNRNDDPAEASTVYLVGSDRISSELYAINRAANGALPSPLTLD